MRLTLKSLQTEMRSSFSEMSLLIDKLDATVNARIDKLDVNLNERMDGISLKLDRHIKETAYEFRNIDERFNRIDRRFDRLTGEIIDSLSGYFTNIEKMLANHEDRIITLEQKR